jgi:hypothetical protein
MDLKVEDGKVVAYRTKVNAWFEYEGHLRCGLRDVAVGPSGAWLRTAENDRGVRIRNSDQRDDPGNAPGSFLCA